MADLRAQLQEELGGSYALERELGRGGMATVFLARDLKHDRPVALKVLHPELAASLGPDRFQREIRLAARLQHPHILTVLDSGTVGQAAGRNERLWFTMPYVEGESLRDRLRRERQLPVEDALRVAREAAQALQYAHEHGVIHRDIKPENLLLTRDGNTLVADFGIARAVEGGDERLTETGLAVGTPAYMSPEQAAGDKGLDARTDVYSLAAVLYEMLAGQPPYVGATTQVLVMKRLTEAPPSARAVRTNVPESVDQAIRKALSPVAADRFAGMAPFAAALQGASTVGSSAAPRVVTTGKPGAPADEPGPVRRGRRVPVAATALVLGILIGLGVLFAWRRSQGNGTGGSRVLAVLPFENLGDSADAYFADGVTDEVRTKLAKVAGLYVIARGSSNEYRGTTKRAQDIAHELGAGYLLTGTVRWTKAADGTSRVRVAPELVELQPGQPPRTRWGEQFDAGITDVFQVQAEIAGKVARALDVALADSVRSELVARPTRSVAAYDAFLKGEAEFTTATDMPGAITWYREAVRLDPSFALAWARLAQVASLHAAVGAPPELIDLARRAVDRARSLAPDDPATYAARAYAEKISGGTPERALEIAEQGLRLAPNDVELLGVASLQDMVLGRYEDVVALLERAIARDPRAANLHRRIGYAYMVLHRYPEAQAALDRAMTLGPGSVTVQHALALLGLMQGETEPTRRIAATPKGVTGDQMIAYLSQYEELHWALDERQQDRLLELGPGLFEDNRAPWALTRAHLYWMRGDKARARVWADTSRREFETHLRAAPDDPQPLVAYGTALAYLGRRDEAIRAGRRALEVLPPSKDMFLGPYVQHQVVRIYMALGEYEQAFDLLEPLLSMPYTLTPAWLAIDPMFDPVRKHPRFQRLVGGTS